MRVAQLYALKRVVPEIMIKIQYKNVSFSAWIQMSLILEKKWDERTGMNLFFIFVYNSYKDLTQTQVWGSIEYPAYALHGSNSAFRYAI